MQFDADITRLLDDAYQGADIMRRRLANLAALAAEPGDHVADIGAGPGFMAMELSRAVGAQGSVVAIDPSADMRETAARRCAGRENVRVVDGTANALPLDDESLDRAVSVQVFEYVEDIPGALTEIRRVLRPGGRLVIGDLHWDSHVWHADDPARMDRMLTLWDRHLIERRVPALLPPALRAAGFEVTAVHPEICQDCVLRADGLARMMMHLIAAYGRRNRHVDTAEVEDWVAEQHRMAEEGRFFFAITHYVVTAVRC